MGSGNTIISKEDMDDIMKTINYLEESVLLMKGVSETIKQKYKQEDFSELYQVL